MADGGTGLDNNVARDGTNAKVLHDVQLLEAEEALRTSLTAAVVVVVVGGLVGGDTSTHDVLRLDSGGEVLLGVASDLMEGCNSVSLRHNFRAQEW